MTIKSDFEKAFEEKFGINKSYYEMLDAANWGYMMGRADGVRDFGENLKEKKP